MWAALEKCYWYAGWSGWCSLSKSLNTGGRGQRRLDGWTSFLGSSSWTCCWCCRCLRLLILLHLCIGAVRVICYSVGLLNIRFHRIRRFVFSFDYGDFAAGYMNMNCCLWCAFSVHRCCYVCLSWSVVGFAYLRSSLPLLAL